MIRIVPLGNVARQHNRIRYNDKIFDNSEEHSNGNKPTNATDSIIRRSAHTGPNKVTQRQVRAVCLSSVVILLGIAALLDRTSNNNVTLLGVLLVLGGGSGAGYQGLLVYRMTMEQRKRVEELARRAVIRAERRKRAHERRSVANLERERVAAAELKRRDQRVSDSRHRTAIEMFESQAKAARDAKLTEHVLQLQSQSHAEFAHCTASIFSNRGWHVTVPDLEAPFDMVLIQPNEEGEPERRVARCVPPDRTAGITDLLALESWREREAAAHGYLVSAAGFDVEVVRAVRLWQVKITLVEAHLLALWSSRCTA